MGNINLYKNKKGIYKLTISNHIYIGSTVNLSKRLKRHMSDLKRDDHENTYLQRAYNKYGKEQFSWEVLEIVDNLYSTEELLALEKHYIEWYNADLNLKKDPTTQQNCITTSKVVYQFNLFGELIKKWPSISEAARFYNVNDSNISVCINNKSRQKICANFLWDDCETYSGSLEILYTFDLKGTYLERFANTVDIYKTYFTNCDRKVVLSSLRKRIDSNIPYKNIYISTSQTFKPDPNYISKFHEKTELEKILEQNPLIYVFNKNGNLIYSKNFKDFNSPAYVKKALQTNKNCKHKYSLTKDVTSWTFIHPKSVSIIAIEITTNKSFNFKSLSECGQELFGDSKESRNISKHMRRNTPYKNYIFKRDM